MKHKFSYVVVVILLSLVLFSPTLASPPDPGSLKSSDGGLRPADDMFTSFSNSFVRLEVDDDGQFVIGTTGGDPAISTDDNKRLLFGFSPDGQSYIGTSFTSVRVKTGETTTDISLRSLTPTQGPTNQGDSIVTVWMVTPHIQIQETLTPLTNPYSGRADTIKIQYTATNLDGVVHSVGVRCMLDIMVGNNDAAPYFVPGVGNSNKEQEYTAANMPAYYFAFESNSFAADSLKGQGMLTGFGMTPPDRFVIAKWGSISGTRWDYTVQPDQNTGDSATAMYWNPVTLGANQSVTFVTAYGLSGKGGSSTWITAPTLVNSETTNIVATVWVNNTTLTSFTNGIATISLPAGLQLHSSETLSKPLGDVPAGTVRQANWSVDIIGGTGTYDYSVESTFVSGSNSLTALAQLVVAELKLVYLPLIKK
ncbi:hypothetical protein TFLX_01209 [Thermoflexales bacterium]|nr:hypothetical protein TFLX_01209 [Thermoflexales bacterium]